MRIGRAHLERIAREEARGGRVVVMPGDIAEDAAGGIVAALGEHDTLFIHGAEQGRFDGVKAGLIELGHMGVCPEARESHLWWGARRGWEGRDNGRGALPAIVSYYTMNTAYEEEARGLVETCAALGLEHRVVGVPARGSWEGNCAMKAGFVLEMWESLGRAVLWVDADARVRRPPDLLRGMTADLGVHKAGRWQFASGTVFVNATELGGELLRAWKRRCDAEPRVWDQVHLDRAWEEVAARAPLETAWLPQAYTRIFDRAEESDGGGSAVVEHFQASRRLKKAVTAEAVSTFVDFDEETKAARRASRPCTLVHHGDMEARR
jgi:hypothetical protein